MVISSRNLLFFGDLDSTAFSCVEISGVHKVTTRPYDLQFSSLSGIMYLIDSGGDIVAEVDLTELQTDCQVCLRELSGALLDLTGLSSV